MTTQKQPWCLMWFPNNPDRPILCLQRGRDYEQLHSWDLERWAEVTFMPELKKALVEKWPVPTEPETFTVEEVFLKDLDIEAVFRDAIQTIAEERHE